MLAEMTLRLDGEIRRAAEISATELVTLLDFLSKCGGGTASPAAQSAAPPVEAAAEPKPAKDKVKRSSVGKTESVDIDELKYLYHDENLSGDECAERLGISIWAFRKLVKENGLNKGRGKKSAATIKRAALSREQFREIALRDLGLEEESTDEAW